MGLEWHCGETFLPLTKTLDPDFCPELDKHLHSLSDQWAASPNKQLYPDDNNTESSPGRRCNSKQTQSALAKALESHRRPRA